MSVIAAQGSLLWPTAARPVGSGKWSVMFCAPARTEAISASLSRRWVLLAQRVGGVGHLRAIGREHWPALPVVR
jgi:hypothetical protein